MEDFLKAAGALLNRQSDDFELNFDLILEKAELAKQMSMEFGFRHAIAFEPKRKKLFPKMLDGAMGGEGHNGETAEGLSEKEEENFPAYLDIIELFLQPDYEPPVPNLTGIYYHLHCLWLAYIAILESRECHFVALQRLDIAGMKLFPVATMAGTIIEKSDFVEKTDRHIKIGRGRSQAAEDNPEWIAFFNAYRQLRDEVEEFPEMEKASQFRVIKARMVKCGFDSKKLDKMNLTKNKRTRYNWLDKALQLYQA